MKILFTCLVLFSALWSICFAQVKIHPHVSASLKSNPENVVFISNESYAILVGAIEYPRGAFSRSISVTNLVDRKTKIVDYKTTTNVNADLFGHHIEQSSFLFFENIYDQKLQSNTLILHELDLSTFEFKEHVIYKDKKAPLKPQIKFVKNPNSPMSALYSMVNNRIMITAEVHFLDGRFNILKTEKAELKGSLDNSFDWRLEMNSLGELMMFHKLAFEDKGTTFVYHFLDNSSNKRTDESLKVIYSNENAQINDVKVFLNDNSQVEFMALYKENNGSLFGKKVVFMTFHPVKGAPYFETSFELKIGDNSKLHTFLPLNEDFSIIITQSEQISRSLSDAVRAVSDISSDNRRRSEEHPNQVLTVFYIHNQKGILYQKVINLDFDKTKLGVEIYNEQVFDYSFWSDGSGLFALHNMITPHVAHKESSNVIAKRSEVNQPSSVLIPSLSYFDVNSGMSKEAEPISSSRMKHYQMLPSTFQIHSTRHAVMIAQTERQVFLPVQIFF